MASTPNAHDAGRMVLVAEDDADIRELVSRKLGSSGFDVIAVGDGLRALHEARERRPDLAVLDVMMPGMSGLDLIAALRADEATADMPIILLTARSQEFDVAEGLAMGASDYILKPFSPRDLVKRVHAALATADA